MNKRKYAALALLLCGVYWLGENVVWSFTDSVEYRVFLKANGEIVKGDYVSVAIPDGYKEYLPVALQSDGDIQMLSKRVACMPGDELVMESKGFSCNGDYLGSFLEETIEGKKLTPANITGPVPEGMVYVSGTHERSFDSRYFGLVPIDQLIRLRGVL